MRPALLAALLLTACAPLAPIAPAAKLAEVDAQQVWDAGATLAAAVAGATYAAQQTHAAATTTQQHAQQQATLVAAEVWATQQAVGAQATMSAISATAQQAIYIGETATVGAAHATQTATAAIPAATATRAAQIAQHERNDATWLWGGVVMTVVVLVMTAAAAWWVHSRGAERIARGEAEKIRAQGQQAEAEARAYATRIEAERAATVIQIHGQKMLVMLAGKVTDERMLEAAPVNVTETIEQPPARPANVPPEYQDAMEFLEAGMLLREKLYRAAVEAKAQGDTRARPEDWPADRLPGAAHFEAAGIAKWSNGSTWQRMVNGMSGAFVASTKGTFCNRERGYKALRDVYAGLRRTVAERLHEAHAPQ